MRPNWRFFVGVLLLTGSAHAQEAPDSEHVLSRLSSSDRNTRLGALTYLIDHPTTSADVLIRFWEIGETDPDDHLRATARQRRGMLEPIPAGARRGGVVIEQVAPDLIAAAQSGEVSRRRIAIMILPHFGGSEGAATLEELAEADEPELRDVVFRSRIHLIPEAERPEFAVEGLKSPHPEVVDEAALYIDPKSRTEQYIPLLRQLESDPNAGVWASLILARWGESIERPVEVLVEFLESDRDWLRNAAAYALAYSGDEGVQTAIELLEHPSLDARLDLSSALHSRLYAVLSPREREEWGLVHEVLGAEDRAAAIRGLKEHGLKAATLHGQLHELLASERQHPSNKPLADAAVVALQDLYRLAAEVEAETADTADGR